MATKKRGTLSAFAKSYNQARQAGDQEFMYGDKMYSTRQKGESATNYVNPNFDINQPRSFGYGTNVDFPTVKSGPRESDPLQHQIQEDLIAKRGDDVNEYRDWVDTQHTFDYVNKNMRWPNGTFDLTRRQQQVLNPMRSNFMPSKELPENKKMGGPIARLKKKK